MSSPDLTDDVRQFIFEFVDSAGQLDVLLYMREHAETFFDADSLSRELRLSSSTAAASLNLIFKTGLLSEDENKKGWFRYHAQSSLVDQTVARLYELYKIKPHKIFELIFSPAKRARPFADAFALTKNHKPEDENG